MRKDHRSWKFFLLKRVPVYFLFMMVGILIGIASLFYYFKQNMPENDSTGQKQILPEKITFHQISEKNYQLIKPLFLTESTLESDEFKVIKENIVHFINKKKEEGVINSASVYIRKLNNGSWMSVNKDEFFSPGSLMKIPTLISILKDAERNPAILEKLIFFNKHFGGIPEQTQTGEPLKEASYYKVKDLLYQMIVHSNNDATALLNQNLNFNTMKKLFNDLQLPEPDYLQPDYKINVADCSRFLRVLFDATYLNKEMSQYALELLTKSAFRDGIVKELNPAIRVAHKFGERNNNGEQQLHEFGIIYYDDDPYLIGIMTKGQNNKILPQILSGVSGMVYQSMLH